MAANAAPDLAIAKDVSGGEGLNDEQKPRMTGGRNG
jgi:hypothetical protein